MIYQQPSIAIALGPLSFRSHPSMDWSKTYDPNRQARTTLALEATTEQTG
jgi:hypothetical protein